MPAPVSAGGGSGAEARRLEAHVRRLEGSRHPLASPVRHRAAARYVADELERTGWPVEDHVFEHDGRRHRNVVGRLEGARGGGARVLVGAHYDTVPGTPGADDNASGVAVLLELARLLGGGGTGGPVELVAFDLEEPTGLTYRVGSRAWVADAGERGVRYAGALVLEMVGYTDARPGSQEVPWLLRWKRIPSAGTFLAAVGDGASGPLLRRFEGAAARAAPDLELVTSRIPFRGRVVPHARLSDNASFWDAGIPALMLTDTAFLRNPNYHGPGDRAETLDYDFMRRVTLAVAGAVRELAGAA